MCVEFGAVRRSAQTSNNFNVIYLPIHLSVSVCVQVWLPQLDPEPHPVPALQQELQDRFQENAAQILKPRRRHRDARGTEEN